VAAAETVGTRSDRNTQTNSKARIYSGLFLFAGSLFTIFDLRFLMPGTLYLVATPIGNLKDISKRALETLQGVDLIACEDTRHTGKLLNAYGISKKLVSYHEHNEFSRADELARRLANGESIALVSDAGTPSISDPGFRLVEQARDAGGRSYQFRDLLLSSTGLSCQGSPLTPSSSEGFSRHEKANAEKPCRRRCDSRDPCFYESPHRLGRSLADCAEVLGPRKAAVVRELTKLHEEVINGDLPSWPKNILPLIRRARSF
jgi:16S rRNA (cytidine1402-2'-O)-methyltransferase